MQPATMQTMDARWSDLAKQLVRQWERLSTDRSTFEQHWREIVQRFLPGHTDDFSSRGVYYSPGDKRTEFIYDSRPVTAAERCAAIVESQITPRPQMWARFAPEDPLLEQDQETVAYLDDMARTVARYLDSGDSNFDGQNQQALLNLVLLGTGVLFEDELDGEVGVRFRAIHLGEIFFAQNHQGKINRAWRIFSLTALEAVQEKRWTLPQKIIDAAKDRPDEKFRFLHCVVPRTDRDPIRIDFKGKAFASYYVSLTECCIVGEGGYDSFPYSIARFDQAAGEIYGRSPAMAALPSTKMLNEMKKADIKQVHRISDPVLLLPDDDTLDGFDLAPGANNYGGVDEEGRPRVLTLPIGDRRPAQELGATEVQAIEDAFFLRLFQVLTELPEMTATQSQYRELEKSQLLMPKIARVQKEYCGAIALRTVEILAAQGVLGKAPDKLIASGGRIRVVFSSPVGQIQRAGEAAGIMQAVGFLADLTGKTGDMSYIDRVDSDEIGKNLPMIMGNEARYIRSDEAVAEIQKQRAQAEQEKAIRDAAPGAAAIVSSTAKMAGAMGGGVPGGQA